MFGTLVRTVEQGRVLDSSGEFQIVPSIAAATKQPHPRGLIASTPDISVVTQCSYNHLHRLIALNQRWQVNNQKLFTMIEKLIRPSRPIYSPLFKIYWILNNYILMEFCTFSEYPKDKLLGI